MSSLEQRPAEAGPLCSCCMAPCALLLLTISSGAHSRTDNIAAASLLMTTPAALQAPLQVMLASSNTAEGHAECEHHDADVEAQRQQAAGPLPAGTDEDAASKSLLLEEEAAIAVAEASCLAAGPASLQDAGPGIDSRPWWERDNPGELL